MDDGINKIKDKEGAMWWKVRATAKVTHNGRWARKSRQKLLPGDRPRSEAMALKEQLEAVAREACLEALGLHVPGPTQPQTLRTYAPRWASARADRKRWSGGKRQTVAHILAYRILPTLGHLHPSDVGRAHIQGWWDGIVHHAKEDGEPYAKGTLLSWWKVLRPLVRDWVADHGYPDPIVRIEIPQMEGRPVRPMRAPERGEVLRLLAQIGPWGEAGYRMRRLVGLLAFTGCRVSEVTRLDWERVDLERGCFQLGASHTKTRRGRLVTLLPEAVQTLRAERVWQEEALGRPHRLCFPSWRTGRPYSRQAVNIAVSRAYVLAGLGHLSPHDLRRGLVTEWLAMGIAPEVIQAQTGHETRAMLGVYAKLTPEQIRGAVCNAGVQRVEEARALSP